MFSHRPGARAASHVFPVDKLARRLIGHIDELSSVPLAVSWYERITHDNMKAAILIRFPTCSRDAVGASGPEAIKKGVRRRCLKVKE